MKSIRVYNNVLAFTSIGASETTALNVDDSVTRDGVYNFRVQNIMVQQTGDRYHEALVEYRRRVDADESTEDNPALRLNDFLPQNNDRRLRLHLPRHANPATRSTPTTSEVAAIVIDHGAALYRYILLKTRGAPATALSNIPYVSRTVNEDGHTTFLTLAFILYVRTTSDSLILRAGRLTKQYCEDQWAKLELARLRFIENNQLKYRLETL
ncbi:Helitron helicase [Phytophthora megakarya]|uniref:Helitron helicase n=1 Tax=Phytophthora megakarya TaxID=4795 RepID=A0A225UGE4_9STRA|nr:Helitron helicase [Phytophthora megakarya]